MVFCNGVFTCFNRFIPEVFYVPAVVCAQCHVVIIYTMATVGKPPSRRVVKLSYVHASCICMSHARMGYTCACVCMLHTHAVRIHLHLHIISCMHMLSYGPPCHVNELKTVWFFRTPTFSMCPPMAEIWFSLRSRINKIALTGRRSSACN